MEATVFDLQLALAHYRMQFPNIASLGAGTPPALWYGEYARVASEGLAATLITELNYEGGSTRGIVNFDQKTLIRALLLRRSELDCEFDEIAFREPEIRPRRRISTRVWI